MEKLCIPTISLIRKHMRSSVGVATGFLNVMEVELGDAAPVGKTFLSAAETFFPLSSLRICKLMDFPWA